MAPEPQSTANPFTLDEALAWVAEMFEEDPAGVKEDTRRLDIPAWDSLGQLVLMSKLDERFGIRLAEAELSKLQAVRDILDVLRKHGQLSGD